MNAELLEGSIEAIMEEAQNKIESLAVEYRAKVLLPFCKEKGLKFAAGNGTFCFFDRNNNAVYLDGSFEEPEFDPAPDIIAVLNLATTSSVCDFSHYIQDITEEDIDPIDTLEG